MTLADFLKAVQLCAQIVVYCDDRRIFSGKAYCVPAGEAERLKVVYVRPRVDSLLFECQLSDREKHRRAEAIRRKKN